MLQGHLLRQRYPAIPFKRKVFTTIEYLKKMYITGQQLGRLKVGFGYHLKNNRVWCTTRAPNLCMNIFRARLRASVNFVMV